jgi:hypothetical protein
MRLQVYLIDRAAQGLSKTPLIIVIGRLEDKIIWPLYGMNGASDGFAVRISKNWICCDRDVRLKKCAIITATAAKDHDHDIRRQEQR